MIRKYVIIAVLCISSILAEAPLNRYRSQRFRQAPPRQYFARQQAPYPESSGGEPAAAYGPPSTPKPVYGPPTTPPPQYGPPPPVSDPEITNESSNPDSESVAAQPSRFTNDKLTLPTKKSPQKFSQRLELQQQVQQFQTPSVVTQVQPIQPVQSVLTSPYQSAALQEGYYYIQLPNGAIQRVNYLTQPSVVDNSVLAKLEFRPVAEVQTTVSEPQLFVNTLVQSHVTADE